MRLRRNQVVNAVDLDDNERRVLGRWHPQVAGYDAATVIVYSAELEPRLSEALKRLVEAANQREDVDMEQLVDRMISDSPRPELVHEASRQAQFRLRLMRDHGSYTAHQIADLNHSTDRNRSKLASRWRKDKRIFAVPFDGTNLFLAFQFDESGQPLPVIGEVLRALGGRKDWEVAAWFATPNGLLDQMQPVTVLHERPQEVIEAASLDGRIRRER